MRALKQAVGVQVAVDLLPESVLQANRYDARELKKIQKDAEDIIEETKPLLTSHAGLVGKMYGVGGKFVEWIFKNLQ